MPKRPREEAPTPPTALPTTTFAITTVDCDDDITDYRFDATVHGIALLEKLAGLKTSDANYDGHLDLLLSLVPHPPSWVLDSARDAHKKYFSSIPTRAAFGQLTVLADISEVQRPERVYRFRIN